MHRYLTILLLMLAMVACSDDERFTIEGTIDGEPTYNMRLLYYGDDALKSGLTASRKGKFTFAGSSREPAVVEIFDNDYRLLGRLIASNGREIECRLDPSNPFKSQFKGDKLSERWTTFSNANAEILARGGKAANRLVAEYVTAHPGDMVSAMLLATVYDASCDRAEADTLLHRLTPDVRRSSMLSGYEYLLTRINSAEADRPLKPMVFLDRSDSLRNFNPRHSRRTLLVLTDRHSGREDSIVPRLKELRRKYSESQLAIIDFSLDSDTAVWKQSIRRDSATWLQGWAAGGLAAPAVSGLGIPSLPYFIVADSTGRQLLRTGEIGRVAENESNI